MTPPFYLYYWCQPAARWRQVDECDFEHDDLLSANLCARHISQRRGVPVLIQDSDGRVAGTVG